MPILWLGLSSQLSGESLGESASVMAAMATARGVAIVKALSLTQKWPRTCKRASRADSSMWRALPPSACGSLRSNAATG
eukprot:15165874-Alexandrium_andersonii.AAC.1